MRWNESIRAGAAWSSVALLFAASVVAPTWWERWGGHGDQLLSLARATFANRSVPVARTDANPRQPAALVPPPTCVMRVVHVDLRYRVPARVEPVSPPLAAAVRMPPAAATMPSLVEPERPAVPQPRLVVPTSLLAMLDQLAMHEPCAPWANEVSMLVRRLTDPSASGENPAAEHQQLLAEMDSALWRVPELERSLGHSPSATQLRRASHALNRRLSVWRQATLLDQQAVAYTPFLSHQEAAALSAAFQQVDARLAGENSQAWRDYLELESLRPLTSGETVVPVEQAQAARRVLARMTDSRLLPEQQLLLSEGSFAALRAALVPAAHLPLNSYELTSRLERFEDTRLSSDARQVAIELETMAQSREPALAELARTLDEDYRNSNLRITVTPALLERFLPATSPQTSAVRDTILGLPVRGQATTSTQLSVRLVPNSNQLELALEATGAVQSQTMSQSGSVQVYSRSQSNFSAEKHLVLGLDGIVAGPATADAQTQSRLRNVQTKYDGVPLLGSLIRQAAEDQYQERKRAAEREAAGKVEHRTAERIDQLADAQTKRWNAQLKERVEQPLAAMSLEPETVESKTDAQRLTLRVRLATEDQLAGCTPRPRAPNTALASVQIHESALNNLADRLDLNGRTYTVDKLCQHLATRLGAPEWFQNDSQNGDVEIRFAAQDAVRVRLEQGVIELRLAIDRLTSGSQRYQKFQVYVRYRAETAEPTIYLVRDGSVSLEAERLGLQGQLVLRGTFSRIFPDEKHYVLLGKLLDGDPRVADPRLAGLKLSHLIIDDGWIGLALTPMTSAAPGTAPPAAAAVPPKTPLLRR